MSYRLPPLSALRAFEAASRHLSFKKAAEEIHVTPAAISQQIKALESYLGASLFVRLPRGLEITPQGRAMIPKIREGFECLAAAVEATRLAEERTLTVKAPPSFAAHWLVPRLPRFSSTHPDLELRLISSADAIDRRGDHATHEQPLVDLRDADSDVSIRYGTGHYPGLHVERIFVTDYVPVCSPKLATADRPLRTPADLRYHVLIHDDTILDGGKRPTWEEWLEVAGVTGLDTRRGTHFSNAVLAVGAALEGQGITLTLKPLVAADVAAGRLMIPFDIAIPSPYAYFLVMSEATYHRSNVRAFRDWLQQEAQATVPSTPEPAIGPAVEAVARQ